VISISLNNYFNARERERERERESERERILPSVNAWQSVAEVVVGELRQ